VILGALIIFIGNFANIRAETRKPATLPPVTNP